MFQKSVMSLALLGFSLVVSGVALLGGGPPSEGECSICELTEPVAMEIRCVHGKSCGVMLIPASEPEPEEKKKKKVKDG